MHAYFNKNHKVSPRLSRTLHGHFWQEIRRVKIRKCPLDSSAQGDAKPLIKLQRGGLRLELAGYFVTGSSKLSMHRITRISRHKVVI